MSQNGSPNRLEFQPDAMDYFVKSLMAGLSLLIYAPAGEQITQLVKYMTSKMRFPDGTTVSFEGNAAMLQPAVLPVTIVIWAQIILHSILEDGLVEQLASAAMSLATAYVTYGLMVAVMGQLVTNHGSRLRFGARVDEYLKWQLLFVAASAGPAIVGTLLLPSGGFLAALGWIAIALVSLVLMGCLILPYFQWLAKKVEGGTRLGRFEAELIELIGVYVGFVVFSVLIVTIPWSVAWFTKWMLGRYSLPARSSMAASGYSV